ncbi:MAG TPA: hypothetical protein VFF00_07835 [Candidatus Elarobacter sp.]|nr:hypothetical protein [Dongiaceae bacterium]HZW53929.1 hypothetical protein [Candidatus Elarobacter sp.]
MIAPPALDLLHRPLAALVRVYGAPASVATRDDGQHVVFGDASATVSAIVDDDATIHAVDLAFPAGTRYAVEVEGKTHTLTFGATTSTAARDELAADAETDGANFRVFRRGADSALVLVFDPKTAALAHVVAGDRATLLRLGYLTDPTPNQVRFPFTAPVLRRSAVPDGSGPRATVLRLDLDRGGAVKKVAIVVPSDDAAFDQQLVARLATDAYAPAKLGGRAIGASVLREVRH